jgi:hypothetical protein
MFVALSMVSTVNAKEDERQSSLLVKKIKYSAQHSVIKTPGVVKT